MRPLRAPGSSPPLLPLEGLTGRLGSRQHAIVTVTPRERRPIVKRPSRRLLALALLAGAAAAFPVYRALTRPPARYSVRGVAVDFDARTYTASRAWDINNKGDIVGTVSGWNGGYPFVDRNGMLTRLPLPESTYSLVRTNDRGDLLLEEMGEVLHLLLLRNGKVTEPEANGEPLIRGALGEDGSVAGAIRMTRPAKAAIWHDGRVSVLSDLAGGGARTIHVNDMASQAIVVGHCDGMPVLWRSGNPIALTVMPGYTHGQALAANGKEQVVGYCDRASATGMDIRACLWDDGSEQDLGTLWALSQANDINEHGVIVGASAVRGRFRINPSSWRTPRKLMRIDPAFRATLFENGKAIDLNTLIPRRSGWTLHDAAAINDKGQIVGTGRYRDQQRGFVLTPVITASGGL